MNSIIVGSDVDEVKSRKSLKNSMFRVRVLVCIDNSLTCITNQ